MTKLSTEEGAFDLVCTDDWLYYRIHCTRHLSQPYAYFKHDLVQNLEVTSQEFNRIKYRGAMPPFQDGEEVVFLPDGQSLRSYLGAVPHLFSARGEWVRALPDSVVAGDSIYSIALDGRGYLWTAEPTFHYVGQYDLTTGNRLFSLGGSFDAGEINHPEDISIYDNDAFISDMGNERLVLLDTCTKRFNTYRTFTQPVWQYRRFKQQELVHLQDGFYLL